MAQIKVLGQDCVKNSLPVFYTFRKISCQKALPSGRTGSSQAGPVHRLNDSASPKMVINIYFIIFRSVLKVLEWLKCRRRDPYVTANKNFARFAHS